MVHPEFFKGKVDVTKYEYHVEPFGSCAFIHGADDLTTGVWKPLWKWCLLAKKRA